MSLATTGWPNSRAWPPLAGSRPVSIFMVVVLPQPLEPRNPKISPRRMRKLTWSTATKSPKRIVRSCASIATSAKAFTGSACTCTGWCCWRLACGSRAMNAASKLLQPVCASKRAGLPVASTRPSSMATSQSKRWASSM